MRAASPLLPANPVLSFAIGPRIGGGRATVDAEVSLEQQLEIGGERRLRLAAARRLRTVYRLGVEQARWEVHRLVHSAYHGALLARERVGLATAVAAFNKKLLVIAKRRHKADDISRLQVRLVAAEVAQATQARIAAQSAYAAARLWLAQLSGWPTSRPPEPIGRLDPPRRAPALTKLARLLAGHPALRARRAAVLSARSRVSLAARLAWPKPSLILRYAREAEPRSPGSSESHTITLGIGIPLPVWQRNQGERARAEVDVALARARLRATRRILRARLARAVQAVNAGAARVAAYGDQILSGFQKSLGMLRRAYVLGEIDVLRLLVARGRFLRMKRDHLRAYAAYFKAVSTLEAVVGADVWPHERHDGRKQR